MPIKQGLLVNKYLNTNCLDWFICVYSYTSKLFDFKRRIGIKTQDFDCKKYVPKQDEHS